MVVKETAAMSSTRVLGHLKFKPTNHHDVYFKYLTALYVNCNSIKLKIVFKKEI